MSNKFYWKFDATEDVQLDYTSCLLDYVSELQTRHKKVNRG